MAEPLPYREESSDELGAVAASTWTYRYDLDGANEQVVLSGPCPACDDTFVYPWPLALVRDAVSARSRGLPVPVLCRCDIPHPGAPRGERGCGRGWTLTVPAL